MSRRGRWGSSRYTSNRRAENDPKKRLASPNREVSLTQVRPGCIEADHWNQLFMLQDCSRSTNVAHFCTAANSICLLACVYIINHISILFWKNRWTFRMKELERGYNYSRVGEGSVTDLPIVIWFDEKVAAALQYYNMHRRVKRCQRKKDPSST